MTAIWHRRDSGRKHAVAGEVATDAFRMALAGEMGEALIKASYSSNITDYGERKIRAALRLVPDGVYAFEDWIDADTAGGSAVPIRVRVTVAGEEIALDFTGTGAQVAGDINVVHLGLLATVYYALKALLGPTIPANGGFYRAIRVNAPEGSIVNARPPAAVARRTQTCQLIADAIFRALVPTLPGAVIAAGNGANAIWVWSGTRPDGQYYVYLETVGGGSGARATKDGLDGVQVHVTSTSNLPVECLEMEYPHLYDLQADKPRPLVPRALRVEVRERLTADGTVLEKLRVEDVEAALEALRVAAGRDLEALAICFLYSFLDPTHERLAGDVAAQRWPGCYVALSSDVSPEFREYERLSTTVINAALGPLISRYVGRFAEEVRQLGVPGARWGSSSSHCAWTSSARA